MSLSDQPDRLTPTPGAGLNMFGSSHHVYSTKARQIASELIFDKLRGTELVQKESILMKRLVTELIHRHESDFTEMIQHLELNEMNHGDIVLRVMEQIFADGHVNWGRLVSIYAFLVKIIESLQEKHIQLTAEQLDQLASSVGQFVFHRYSSFFDEHGGWNGFCHFFEKNQRAEGLLLNTLIVIGIGIGTLATIFATR